MEVVPARRRDDCGSEGQRQVGREDLVVPSEAHVDALTRSAVLQQVGGDRRRVRLQPQAAQSRNNGLATERCGMTHPSIRHQCRRRRATSRSFHRRDDRLGEQGHTGQTRGARQEQAPRRVACPRDGRAQDGDGEDERSTHVQRRDPHQTLDEKQGAEKNQQPEQAVACQGVLGAGVAASRSRAAIREEGVRWRRPLPSRREAGRRPAGRACRASVPALRSRARPRSTETAGPALAGRPKTAYPRNLDRARRPVR